MALKKCKECGKEVSTSAKKCPNCGVKDPTSNPLIIAFVTIGMLLFFGYMCSNFGSDDNSSSRINMPSYKYEASTKEGKIERSISNFATIKRININEYADMVTVMYLQTFGAWDDDDVRKKTKEHMGEVIEAAFLYSGMKKASIAPYFPSQSDGEIAIALLRINESEYVEGKDVEYYDNFFWKD